MSEKMNYIKKLLAERDELIVSMQEDLRQFYIRQEQHLNSYTDEQWLAMVLEKERGTLPPQPDYIEEAIARSREAAKRRMQGDTSHE